MATDLAGGDDSREAAGQDVSPISFANGPQGAGASFERVFRMHGMSLHLTAEDVVEAVRRQTPLMTSHRDLKHKLPPTHQEIVRRAEKIVLASFPRRLGEETLAQALGVPLASLRGAFELTCGESVYRAMLRLRVQVVQQALKLDPSLSALAVARWCGFKRLGPFRRAYQDLFGPLPDGLLSPASVCAKQAVSTTYISAPISPHGSA